MKFLCKSKMQTNTIYSHDLHVHIVKNMLNRQLLTQDEVDVLKKYDEYLLNRAVLPEDLSAQGVIIREKVERFDIENNVVATDVFVKEALKYVLMNHYNVGRFDIMVNNINTDDKTFVFKVTGKVDEWIEAQFFLDEDFNLVINA